MSEETQVEALCRSIEENRNESLRLEVNTTTIGVIIPSKFNRETFSEQALMYPVNGYIYWIGQVVTPHFTWSQQWLVREALGFRV